MSSVGSEQLGDDLGTLHVWDADGYPPQGNSKIVLWRSFGCCSLPDAVSIPDIVEKNADVLRGRYLSWIYDLGQTSIGGKRLVDHLELRAGFGYWWMTLLVEKCNYGKSPQINDAIRLMAFENWATTQSFSRVEISTANIPLAQTMRSWCEEGGISFLWQRLAGNSPRSSWLRRFNNSLPNFLRALIWFVLYVVRQWPLRGVGLSEWKATRGKLCFVSYLFNLIPDAQAEGRFESPYWADLPDQLRGDGCWSNWLHLHVSDRLLPNAKRAANAIHQFNMRERGFRSHVTLDSFLGLALLTRVLRDWLRLARIGFSLQPKVFATKAGEFDFGPLFERELRQSLFGQPALSNVLFFNLFEAALEALPDQQIGVYLQENQGWEFALIQTWKAAGHGVLIGSPHSTVRFWDLRYFFDPRSYQKKGGSDLPLPNQVALNGPAALYAYRMAGYPAEDLLEVEALRYLYLAKLDIKTNLASRQPIQHLRILVLGDYLPGNTYRQLRLLEEAATAIQRDTLIVVKPHPACPVDPKDYPGLAMSIATSALPQLLSNCDVAYTSSTTSAAVDAYCAGVPVVSMADPCNLNLSPLRGLREVDFANSSDQLARILNSIEAAKASPKLRKQYFTVDTELPRWRALVAGTFADGNTL